MMFRCTSDRYSPDISDALPARLFLAFFSVKKQLKIEKFRLKTVKNCEILLIFLLSDAYFRAADGNSAAIVP